jgi:hypothetical protein
LQACSCTCSVVSARPLPACPPPAYSRPPPLAGRPHHPTVCCRRTSPSRRLRADGRGLSRPCVAAVVAALNAFMASADSEPSAAHLPHTLPPVNPGRPVNFVELTRHAWELVSSTQHTEIPAPHNALLKLFALRRPTLVRPRLAVATTNSRRFAAGDSLFGFCGLSAPLAGGGVQPQPCCSPPMLPSGGAVRARRAMPPLRLHTGGRGAPAA